jgi:tetratricopeptide (TPR) repeat protein
MFLDAKTRNDEASRHQTNEYFRKNLKEILQTAKDAGAPVILCTIASNLKDCAPFASLPAPGLTESLRGEWETFFKAGVELEAAKRWPEAITRYGQAAAIDGDFAELQFRLGRCYLASDQTDKARRCFELARDLDALPFRASSTQNEIIKAAASESAGNRVFLLDVEDALAETSPQKIIGAEFFYEHVHLNFDGNQRLARLVAEKAAALLPERLYHSAPRDWPAPEFCDQRLAVTPWDRHRVYQNVAQRENQPPFTLQLNHSDQVHKLSRQLQTFRAQMDSNEVSRARSVYQQALQERPEDFILHSNFAKFLEETGDLSGAAAAWQRVCELLPHHFGPDFYLGKLLARLGRLEEAEARLSRTLQIRPDAADSLDELGRVLIRQKRAAEALVQFKKALALQPGNARLHLHLAEALAAQDRRDEAMTSLRRAIELRPEYWEARYLLGVELAMRGEISDAGKQFSEVVRLKPDHTLAHLNLAVALAKQNRVSEAILEFRQTLRLDPSNRTASEYLSKLRAN